ncbi:MAG: rhodanese-like domain-containing protein, partial [Acidobacteriota bacterium]
IPCSINIGNADDSARLYQNPDGMLRSFGEVRAMWQQAGIKNDDREVIFYCGSGWRSSVAFLHAWAMGYKRIRNYSDGWAGWSTNYIQDERAKGGTPGWRQQRSTNPIFIEAFRETGGANVAGINARQTRSACYDSRREQQSEQ